MSQVPLVLIVLKFTVPLETVTLKFSPFVELFKSGVDVSVH